MKKQRLSAAGGILAAAVILVVIGIAATSGSGESAGRRPSYGDSLTRTRARNLRLQSMIALLIERRLQGAGGGPPPRRLSHTTQIASHSAESPPASATQASETPDCDPNYEGACLNPNASDYDCEGGEGNGPYYTGEVRVVGDDHFGLDADGDGIGCEAD
jgi:hypothetical protein